MNRNARNFADLLASLPPEAWETALRRQPEWFGLEDRFPVFGEGPFAVLLTLAGLNAFQLKGKAETGYWTQFPGHVCAMDACSAPNDLAARLEPFYRTERLHDQKVRRLYRFLDSSLAALMWTSSAADLAGLFPSIRQRLASVMGQQATAKTICYAAKCLGIALLICGAARFDASGLPVPVDSRILRLSSELRLCSRMTPAPLRSCWEEILKRIRRRSPQVTMIHLDSLAWQLAGLDPEDRDAYLNGLQNGDESIF